jgi:hypothetical protein
VAWNYETGQEEAKAYADSLSGPYTPPPPPFWGKATLEIHQWEQAEAAVKALRVSTANTRRVIRAWEKAEMAVIGWDKAAEHEKFRRGYMEWLAMQNGGVDSLSDLDLESMPLLERIVTEGYRVLAKKNHPDLGGSADKFREVREAKGKLDQVLSEVGELLRNG